MVVNMVRNNIITIRPSTLCSYGPQRAHEFSAGQPDRHDRASESKGRYGH